MRRVSRVKADDREKLYESTKRLYLVAAALIIGGLAASGSFDRTVGGVLLLMGWASGVVGLHRLGRAGSTPRG